MTSTVGAGCLVRGPGLFNILIYLRVSSIYLQFLNHLPAVLMHLLARFDDVREHDFKVFTIKLQGILIFFDAYIYIYISIYIILYIMIHY